MRICHEAREAPSGKSCFVTLTFSPQQLPEDWSLDPRHWQLFAKRLRKSVGPFRFFAVGEYGEGLRPHYHAILFGVDFSSDRRLFSRRRGGDLYTSECLSRAWGQGFASLGAVSFQSAAYVARYSMKKVNGELAEKAYERVDPETGECWQVRPEFALMSRRPGIGRSWFERFRSDVFPSDDCVLDGKHFKTPRYYDSLYEREDPEGLLSVKARRRKAVSEASESILPSRLAAREEMLDARISRLKREL